MKIMNPKSDIYFPQPESNGGWRFLKDADEITDLTSMNLGKLDDVIESYKFFFDTYASGIAIIQNGHLIKEHYSFMTLPGSRFDIWSCTKSVSYTHLTLPTILLV